MLMNYPFYFLSPIFMDILSLILMDISFIITVCFCLLLDQTSQINLKYMEEWNLLQELFLLDYNCLNSSISLAVHSLFYFRTENLD